MRTFRNKREALSDALISLVFLDLCAAEDGVIGDRLKVTKLLFLATVRSLGQRMKVLNYSFHRYNYGPFTTELYETWSELSWAGFLEVPNGSGAEIIVTEAGRGAAKKYSNLMESADGDGWRSACEVFQQVSDSFCGFSTREILDHVYGMTLVPLGWQTPTTVREAPAGVFFTCALEPNEAKTVIQINDEVAGVYQMEREQNQTEGVSLLGEEAADLYASVINGIRAEKSGAPSTIVSLEEIKRKLGVID